MGIQTNQPPSLSSLLIIARHLEEIAVVPIQSPFLGQLPNFHHGAIGKVLPRLPSTGVDSICADPPGKRRNCRTFENNLTDIAHRLVFLVMPDSGAIPGAKSTLELLCAISVRCP